MMTAKPCPFDSTLQRYWDKRYDYFTRFDDGILIDAEGLHTVMPEHAALAQALLIPEAKTVLDGFCGTGGMSIAHARMGKTVIAIEANAERIEMAKHNARIYGVLDKITFIHGDFFDISHNIKADAALLDPSWGWPRHQNISRFLLSHLQPDGDKLLRFTLKYFNKIILRVPNIFDMSELNRFDIEHRVHHDKLHSEVISTSIIINNKPAVTMIVLEQ